MGRSPKLRRPMPLASHERSRSRGPLQGFRRYTLSSICFPINLLLTQNLCGSLKIIPQNSLRDFCGSPKIIPQNSLRDFCGSPKIIPQNSLRDFCGSPKYERHRVPFLVLKGNEAPRPCQRGREGDGRNGMPQDHKGRIWKFRSWKTERRR